MRRTLLIAALTLFTAACGGPSSSSPNRLPIDTGTNDQVPPSQPGNGNTGSLDAATANGFANQAIHESMTANPTPNGVTVTDNGTTVTIQGTLDEGAATVTMDVTIVKAPFSMTGTITVDANGHEALLTFAGQGASVTIDGQPAGNVPASYPMTSSMALTTAQVTLQAAVQPGFNGSLTITHDGPGAFTIDGTETCGPATVTFTQLKVDFLGHTVNGTITVTADGHTAILTFAGTTVDVNVDGTDEGSFPLPFSMAP